MLKVRPHTKSGGGEGGAVAYDGGGGGGQSANDGGGGGEQSAYDVGGGAGQGPLCPPPPVPTPLKRLQF